jgi:hypothetical protein
MGIFGHEWTIPIAELRGTHRGNERLADSIMALMQTVVTVRLANGQTRRVQLLGGNDMYDEERSRGWTSPQRVEGWDQNVTRPRAW